MKKDTKQPAGAQSEDSTVQPEQEPAGQQAGEAEPDTNRESSSEIASGESAQTDTTEPSADESADAALPPQPAPSEEPDPEDPDQPEDEEEYGDPEDFEDEEEEFWEEDAPLSLSERLFSLSTSLLRWIVLVAVLLVLILGGTFFSMYRNVSLDNLPQYDVSWAGQSLEVAGYNWSVPVMGFLHRDFSKKAGSTHQTLDTVTESHPELELPEYTTARLTIQDASGETLFEGDEAAYDAFHFSENGSYTAVLTVSSPDSTGAQGTYTYQFDFQLEAQPQLVLSDTGVAQGSVIGVRLEGVLGDVAPALTTDLAELPFTLYQGDWVAFVPVDYNQLAGSYDISATVNGQTVTQTVQVYGRQRRELDTYTIDGTAAIPYVGALPKSMDFLWEINDPDIYWDGSFIQPVEGKIVRDYAVLEYTDRLDPTDPLNAAIPLDQIAAYNAAITPRRSINVTLATTSGSPVVAPAAGRVVYAQTNGSLGRVVVIEHGCGVKSLFYLLGRRDVDEGDFVTQGQQIGTTQGHVICEMRVGDIPVNPWDAWRGAGGLFF